MARKRVNIADILNNITALRLYEKFKLVALDAFIWEGLPDLIKPKYIEHALFEYGQAVFFKKSGGSLMCLPAQDGGKLNVYGEPISYFATGFGYHENISAEDCVLIENNELRRATKDFLLFYVNKLTEAERTMDVNVKACKTPYVIACDDKDVLTFKRIFQQIDGNTPAIYADKGLNLDAISVLKTSTEFMGNELMDYKRSVENELLTFLGVNNISIDKKERLNTKEATANDQLIETFADLQLKTRKQACELINAKYGLNVTVRRNVQREEAETNVENDDV